MKQLIVVARKPLSEPTVAENVLKWGTGGINIDGTRIDLNGDNTSRGLTKPKVSIGAFSERPNMKQIGSMDDKWKEGRFPANLILDEEAAKLLDEQSGFSKGSKAVIDGGFGAESNSYINHKVGGGKIKSERGYNDEGGASRYFKIIDDK